MVVFRSRARTGLGFVLGILIAASVMSGVVVTVPHLIPSQNKADGTTGITAPSVPAERRERLNPSTNPSQNAIANIQFLALGLSLIVLPGAVLSLSARRWARKKFAYFSSELQEASDEENSGNHSDLS